MGSNPKLCLHFSALFFYLACFQLFLDFPHEGAMKLALLHQNKALTRGQK